MAVWRAPSLVTKHLERDLKERFDLSMSACEVLSTLALPPDGRMRAMNRVLDAGGLPQEIPDHVEAVNKLRESAQDD